MTRTSRGTLKNVGPTGAVMVPISSNSKWSRWFDFYSCVHLYGDPDGGQMYNDAAHSVLPPVQVGHRFKPLLNNLEKCIFIAKMACPREDGGPNRDGLHTPTASRVDTEIMRLELNSKRYIKPGLHKAKCVHL